MKAKLLLLAAIACAPLPASARTLAIVHAKAWTMTGDTAVENATIVVRDGRIVSVAAAASPPPGAELIDAGGRNVTPGLFAAATQVGLLELSDSDDTDDEAVTAGKLGAAFDVAPAVNSNSLLVQQARADGVLWALSFPSGSSAAPFLGQAALLRLERGEVLDHAGAAMFARVGGASASGAGGSRAAQWSLLRAALSEAKALKAGKSPPAEDRMFGLVDLQALQPVIAGTMPLAIQANRQSDIREAIRLARDYALKVVVVGGAEAWTVAKELAKARIAVILDPGEDLPMSYDELGARLDNAAILDKAGVVIAVAPAAHVIDQSYNVGVASREAAGIAVANGLSYSSALRALTLNAARIWGADARTGSVEAGKSADLVIWDGDPIEPASAPWAVIVGGERSDERTREQQLTERYRSRARDQSWPAAYR